MQFGIIPYKFTLRGARTLHLLLFGAFVYTYCGILQGERILSHLPSYRLEPWHIGTITSICSVVLMGTIQRFMHLPKSWTGEHRLLVFTMLAIVFCSLTSPTEHEILTYKMTRLNSLGRYEESLKASRTNTNPTPKILTLRVEALKAMGILYDDFFTFQGDFDGFQAAPNDKTLRLLLERNLPALARHLKGKDKKHLQRAEREALVLYNRISSNPIFPYQDANTEANYHDFKALEAKTKSMSDVTRANTLREAYGETYWHYFYYGNFNNSDGKYR